MADSGGRGGGRVCSYPIIPLLFEYWSLGFVFISSDRMRSQAGTSTPASKLQPAPVINPSTVFCTDTVINPSPVFCTDKKYLHTVYTCILKFSLHGNHNTQNVTLLMLTAQLCFLECAGCGFENGRQETTR